MVFSTPFFLFVFLPIVLLVYYCAPQKIKNSVLLTASLLFYAWGEVFYVWIMIVSILSNYLFGRLLESEKCQKKYGKRIILAFGIAINLCLLCTFKYTIFLVDNINSLLVTIHCKPFMLSPIHLPLGISFFTFQAISYLVDVFRKEVAPQRNLLNLALYISLFPQLIAGPIVRYKQVARQIVERHHTLAMTASGIQRFVFGLSKKMLIANPMGEVADTMFNLQAHEISMGLSWVGAVCYTIQIYFDFSGYSDMAIGLGRMFGFGFLENFNYPYISRSLQEFWRRWHISLSTWFRDYLYIPLGGNQVSPFRLYLNLFFVFFLCGLWHGASWNFVVWGLIHGLFLVLERSGFSSVLKRLWLPFQHLYTLLIVVAAWVFFRAETLTSALTYLKTMIGLNQPAVHLYTLDYLMSNEALVALVFGILLSLPVYPGLRQKIGLFVERQWAGLSLIYTGIGTGLSCLLFLLAILKVSSGTYNPFIYFRF